MYSNIGIKFELVTENGNLLTEYIKDGLTFVEGRKNSNYKIRVTNNTMSRIKAILSVDGLNILTGKRATPKDSGYVISAHSIETLEGWRISNEEVRKFFFSAATSSYNAKTNNDTNNIGVIGLIAYKEYIAYNRPLTIFDTNRYYGTAGLLQNTICDSYNIESNAIRAMAAPTAASRSLNYAAKIGTGMGEKVTSKVTEVSVAWEAVPLVNMAIYYKTKRELEAMGIIVAPPKIKPLPQPFAGFCKEV